MQRLLLLAVFAALVDPARAFPDPFGAAAAPCTGTNEPKKAPPLCFTGKATVLGMQEQVNVTVSAYQGGHGSVNIDAVGIAPEHCKGLNFTRVPTTNELTFDNPGAMQGCLSGATVKVKYCSDQNSVLLHLSIPHFPIPALPETLTGVPC